MTSEPEFRHHMIKEIFEQPRGLYDTIAPRVSLEEGVVRFNRFAIGHPSHELAETLLPAFVKF